MESPQPGIVDVLQGSFARNIKHDGDLILELAKADLFTVLHCSEIIDGASICCCPHPCFEQTLLVLAETSLQLNLMA